LEALENALETCRKAHETKGHVIASEELCWYVRFRKKQKVEAATVEESKEVDPDEGCTPCLFGNADDGDY